MFFLLESWTCGKQTRTLKCMERNTVLMEMEIARDDSGCVGNVVGKRAYDPYLMGQPWVGRH